MQRVDLDPPSNFRVPWCRAAAGLAMEAFPGPVRIQATLAIRHGQAACKPGRAKKP
jgi:hypothetical protein